MLIRHLGIAYHDRIGIDKWRKLFMRLLTVESMRRLKRYNCGDIRLPYCILIIIDVNLVKMPSILHMTVEKGVNFVIL